MSRAFTVVALLGCVSLACAQPPSDADAAALVGKARAKALAYSESLPDFVATEVIHRYTGPRGTGFHRPPSDSLTVQLRYFRHKEEHKLLLHDGEPTDAAFEGLAGLVESGEFGSTISAIFKPESQTSFRFEKWITVRKRPAARFAYEVDAAHSRYILSVNIDGQALAAVVSYHGILEIDADTGEVLHLEYGADRIPKDLRLTQSATSVDYALAEIGGLEYLLPSYSATELHGPAEWVKNVIEFRDYRKFSADSSIEFGVPK